MAELAAEVLAEVRRVARDELDVEAPIDRASTLQGELRLDSVGLIVVAVALENRFRVRLHEEDAGELATVGDLVALVCRRVDEQQCPAGVGVSARLVGPALPSVPSTTINAALARAAEGSEGITLVDAREEETFVSYAELRASARGVAAALLDRGVRPGNRVALVLPTGRDFLDAFFGAQLAGAVPVPLYPPVRLGRMDEYVLATARMLTAVGAAAVLTDRRVQLLLGRAVERARPPFGCHTVASLRGSRAEAEVEVADSALGVIQFSSGSTVDPKPVALTHAQLVAQCASLRALITAPAGERTVGVAWLPLYHDMGLIGCLLSAVTFPGHLVLLGPESFLARPALWLRALSRHRGTISPAPSFAYGVCVKRVRDDDLAGVDLSSWRHALNGAEPVSVDGARRFAERFAPHGFRREAMMPVYGLSEAALALTFTPSAGEKRALAVDPDALAATGRVLPGRRPIASVGLAVPGAEVEVRDADHRLVGEREVGRVWARAPFLMQGYFGQAEATARALREGWLDTGDLGFVDGGELFLCGRARDLVIVRGANHAPQEFEDALEAVEGLRTGCAVALGYAPADTDGEQLLVLAEAAEPSEALARRAAEAVAERTGVRPHALELLAPGTLPRTSSGKLRRAEALRRYLAGTLRPPGPTGALALGVEMARSAAGFARSRLA